MPRQHIFEPGQRKLQPGALNDISLATHSARKAISFCGSGSLQTPIGTLQRGASPVARPGGVRIYQAVAAAEWSTEAECWLVDCKRVNLDGTLAAVESRKAIGAGGDSPSVVRGNVCLEVVTGGGEKAVYPVGFVVRGTQAVYKVITLRAYLLADDSLVAPGEVYNTSTMYLFPTWDKARLA